jgi:ubiquitin carboxyl-terminal hydrolase 36/42
MFGGWLRSQVTCSICKYQSIKLETFLDLNLEIQGIETLTDALVKFTEVEYLTGPNQYKCKRHVASVVVLMGTQLK